MKKIFALIGIIFLFSSLFVVLVPSVGATETVVWGRNSIDAASTMVANAYLGYNLSTSTLNDATYEVVYGAAYLKDTVGTANVKMAIFNSSLALVAVSDTTVVNTTAAFYQFTFSGTVTLTKAMGYYTFGVISDSQITFYRNGGDAGVKTWVYDTSNSYLSPSSPSDATATDDYEPDFYLMVSSDTDAYPTASPTPATDDTTIQELTDIILPWLVPLLICLIPALLGYKFVGELGFFIGLNVGCILAYVTLASTAYAFPLWGIILVGVMDVAVVLMRR